MKLRSQLEGWSKKELETLAAGAGIATRSARTKETLLEMIVAKGEQGNVVAAVRTTSVARMRQTAKKIPAGPQKYSRAAMQQAFAVIEDDFDLKAGFILREIHQVATICDRRGVDPRELREICGQVARSRESGDSTDLRPLIELTRIASSFIIRNLESLHGDAPVLLQSIETAKNALVETKGLKMLEQSIRVAYNHQEFDQLPMLLKVLEQRISVSPRA